MPAKLAPGGCRFDRGYWLGIEAQRCCRRPKDATHFFDSRRSSRAEDTHSNPADCPSGFRHAGRALVGFGRLLHTHRAPMITRSGLRRERAIITVLRTGRIPGQNVTRSEFCDLVRTAARVRQTPEGFPRGWSRHPS
jgi:hypothetical protein